MCLGVLGPQPSLFGVWLREDGERNQQGDDAISFHDGRPPRIVTWFWACCQRKPDKEAWHEVKLPNKTNKAKFSSKLYRRTTASRAVERLKKSPPPGPQ